MIMRRFDENLSKKTDKTALQDVYNFCDTTYSKIKEDTEKEEKLQAQLADLTKQVSDNQQLIEFYHKNSETMLLKEIKI